MLTYNICVVWMCRFCILSSLYDKLTYLCVCVCVCVHERRERKAVECCCYHDKSSFLSVFLKRCSSFGLICSVCSERCIKWGSEVADKLVKWLGLYNMLLLN